MTTESKHTPADEIERLESRVKELEQDKDRIDFMLKYWLIVWRGKAVVKRSVIDEAMNIYK